MGTVVLFFLTFGWFRSTIILSTFCPIILSQNYCYWSQESVSLTVVCCSSGYYINNILKSYVTKFNAYSVLAFNLLLSRVFTVTCFIWNQLLLLSNKCAGIQNRMCAQRRLRSACAFAQFDQLRTQNFFMRTANTLIRLHECTGWSESLLYAQCCQPFIGCRCLLGALEPDNQSQHLVRCSGTGERQLAYKLELSEGQWPQVLSVSRVLVTLLIILPCTRFAPNCSSFGHDLQNS